MGLFENPEQVLRALKASTAQDEEQKKDRAANTEHDASTNSSISDQQNPFFTWK